MSRQVRLVYHPRPVGRLGRDPDPGDGVGRKRGGPSLPDEALQLQTPTPSDTSAAEHRAEAGHGPSQSQQLLPLTDPETFLPTPRATDGTKGCPAQRGSKGDLMLPSAVIRLLNRSDPDRTS